MTIGGSIQRIPLPHSGSDCVVRRTVLRSLQVLSLFKALEQVRQEYSSRSQEAHRVAVPQASQVLRKPRIYMDNSFSVGAHEVSQISMHWRVSPLLFYCAGHLSCFVLHVTRVITVAFERLQVSGVGRRGWTLSGMPF